MARRDALRAKARSVLIIVLIGLPVLVVAGADIAYRTWQLDPSEQITRSIGGADASLQWLGGGPLSQLPSGSITAMNNAGASADRAPTSAKVLSALPPGSRVIAQTEPKPVDVRSRDGLASADLIGLDYADPIARGIVTQASGRAPSNVHEVAITQHLSRSSGLRIGDTLHITAPSEDFRIVGIVNAARYRDVDNAYLLPAALDSSTPPTWLAATPSVVTWPQVRALNERGYLVVSHYVRLNPPPRSQVPLGGGDSGVSPQVFAAVGMVAGLALLEVVLLAGPAFAVSARRSRHQLALLAAVGGRRQDLRNVVLATAVVLGISAGVAGVALGIGGTAGVIALFAGHVNTIPGHFDVRPWELLGIASISLLSALAAALVPAHGAGRTDVVAALAGRRGTVSTRRRVPLFGMVVAGAGIAIALAGAATSSNAALILAGIALTEIGLIICTPTLLGLISRLGRWLPLAPRIALRDAGRNRSAAASAIAAVMAAVIGSVAAAIIVASLSGQARANYLPELPRGDAYVEIDGSGSGSGATPPTAAAAARIADVVREQLPTRSVTVVQGAASPCAVGGKCLGVLVNPVYHHVACATGQECSSPRIASAYRDNIIDDGSGAEALLGVPAAGAAAALRAGQIVVTDPNYLADGRITLQLDALSATPSDGPAPCPSLPAALKCAPGEYGQSEVTAPATLAPGFKGITMILPPKIAAALGLVSAPQGVLATTTRPPTSAEQQHTRAALQTIMSQPALIVESGYHGNQEWALLGLVLAAGVITVGAATVATALSTVDSRPDLMILGAVGASPQTRRVLTMSRAGVIAVVGTVLGAAAGFVPALAWVIAVRRTDLHTAPDWHQLSLVVPWWPSLIATVVAVPVAAIGVAGMCTRSRLPSERSA
jgi:putative ABC transport system permease protein